MFVVKCAPLAVDSHGQFRVEVQMRNLGDGTALLHVCSIAACSEDTPDLDLGVGIRRGDHSTGCVVDQSGQFDGDSTLGQSLVEGWDNIVALDTVDVEALCPPLEDTVVDEVLCSRVGEGETQRQVLKLLVFVVVFNELLQAVGNVAPELVGSSSLDRKSVV